MTAIFATPIHRARAWANRVLTDADAISFAEKAWHEMEEFYAEPSAEEAADVVICLAAWCDRMGVDLLDAIDAKVAINEQRTWQRKPDGTYQHVTDPRDDGSSGKGRPTHE